MVDIIKNPIKSRLHSLLQSFFCYEVMFPTSSKTKVHPDSLIAAPFPMKGWARRPFEVFSNLGYSTALQPSNLLRIWSQRSHICHLAQGVWPACPCSLFPSPDGSNHHSDVTWVRPKSHTGEPRKARLPWFFLKNTNIFKP